MTDTATPTPITEWSVYSRAILGGLQNSKHVYAGTVPPNVIARRRAANKVARASRRANRQAHR